MIRRQAASSRQVASIVSASWFAAWASCLVVLTSMAEVRRRLNHRRISQTSATTAIAGTAATPAATFAVSTGLLLEKMIDQGGHDAHPQEHEHAKRGDRVLEPTSPHRLILLCLPLWRVRSATRSPHSRPATWPWS